MDIFDDLYDSEINFSITTFWDAGYIVKLGDEDNGFLAEWHLTSMDEAAEHLKKAAIGYYPARDFAKKYGRNQA